MDRKKLTNRINRILQFLSFSVSCYLTMGMFVAMVAGNPATEWIFRGFGAIYETNKVSMLKKSFTSQKKRFVLRFVSIVLMVVSVGGAVLSAVRDTMDAGAESEIALAGQESTIADLVRQRDAYLAKLESLPPEYKTTAKSYGEEIERLQGLIDQRRDAKQESAVVVAKHSGVFETASRVITNGRVKAEALRFVFFLLFIVLNEVVLYFQTWMVAEAELERDGVVIQTISERIGRWKIFHRGIDAEKEVEELVRERLQAAIAEPKRDLMPATAAAMVAAGAQDDLF